MPDAAQNRRLHAGSSSVGSGDSTSKKRSIDQLFEDKTDYPRRRAIIACEVCRARKSKCDGGQPKCRLCTELNAQCVYRERGFKLDARDKLILSKLESIESLLQSTIEEKEHSQLQHNQIRHFSTSTPTASGASGSHYSPASSRDRTSGSGPWEYVFSIPENHSTPWLHLFRHPKIARLLSSSAPPVFSPLALEAKRSQLQLNQNILLDLSHIQPFVDSFFKNVNPFYAIVSPYLWQTYYAFALSRGFRSGPESVIVLTVLALGEASMYESIALLAPDAPIPGINFFATAWPLVSNLVIGNTIGDVQALMLTAAYLFYLVRPVEAWSIVSVVCTKLRSILSTTAYEQLPHDDKEQFERVFWNALLFESDILAELDLPHSGIETSEDNVGLPSGYIAVVDPVMPAPGADNLWYFLAEIALRRLLNRVHHMLYSKTTSKMAISSFHPIVQELDFQLTQWYENLPPTLRFSFVRQRLSDRFSTVLRLRYFVCQSIIWRVYVHVALSDEDLIKDSRIRLGVTKCIDACLRQIEDLEEHRAGHMPYFWQGTLSIVSHLALLMAITTSTRLSQLLPHTLDRMAEIITSGVRTVQDYGRLAPSISAAGETLHDAERKWTREMRELGVLVPSPLLSEPGPKNSSTFKVNG
ncbi:hypothetical protein V1512DRAFT_271719 [Lipomyces arxii]|uniref:uncharacterized protein n=1 Tax=Lipomyces arxii TaxID=56418 RepID=UPI0034CFBCBD